MLTDRKVRRQFNVRHKVIHRTLVHIFFLSSFNQYFLDFGNTSNCNFRSSSNSLRCQCCIIASSAWIRPTVWNRSKLLKHVLPSKHSNIRAYMYLGYNANDWHIEEEEKKPYVAARSNRIAIYGRVQSTAGILHNCRNDIYFQFSVFAWQFLKICGCYAENKVLFNTYTTSNLM